MDQWVGCAKMAPRMHNPVGAAIFQFSGSKMAVMPFSPQDAPSAGDALIRLIPP